MSLEIIHTAIAKGAVLFPNVSGGKDGQAMTKVLSNWKIPMKGLIHADLGRTEWPQSMGMCEKLAAEFNLPLHIIRRSDGRDMIDHWKARLEQMKETAYPACDVVTRSEYLIKPKPFWSDASNRYCTSDLKRDPINKFYRNCGDNFIISCEGIRAEESDKRELKPPIQVRWGVMPVYYKRLEGVPERMALIRSLKVKAKRKGENKIEIYSRITELERELVEICIANYRPDERLALTWFPIFNFTLEEVWNTYGISGLEVEAARFIYKETGKIAEWFPFHPAYAMGNDRVSCMICILGCMGDLVNGAKHNPELLDTMISMEDEGQATFKHNWSLKKLKT